MKLSISTTRKENLLGFGYWLISFFVLPAALHLVSDLSGFSLSPSTLNILFFVTNFVCVTAIFHKFLWASVKVAWAKPWRCLWCGLKGLFIYYFCTFLISFLITPWAGPDFSNVNDNAILELAKEHTAIFIFGTIFLVPVAEEVLFRGLLFQGFYRKNPLLAYCLTTVCFALIHLIGYVGSVDWTTLCICFMQYLPAGIALASAYAASDTIATPIFMHMIINLIGVSALR